MNHSHIVCGEARHEATRPGYAMLLIEDATYVDPMMDAWGQDAVAWLIDGLEAVIRVVWAPIVKWMALARCVAAPRAHARDYRDRPNIPSASSRSPA